MRRFIISMMAFLLVCSIALAESASAKLEELYAEAGLLMVTGDYTGAAEKFDALGAYSDSAQMAMYCKAIGIAETLQMYDMAIDAFEKLGEFKDCAQLVVYYKGRQMEAGGDLVINNLSLSTDDDINKAKQMYELASNFYSQLALYKDCMTRIGACEKKTTELENELTTRSNDRLAYTYAQALSAEGEGRYEEAISLFEKIPGYKDSDTRAKACKKAILKNYYDAGVVLKTKGEWDKAIDSFTKAGNYEDAQSQITETYYLKGLSMQASKDWKNAVIAFKNAGEYSDAKLQISITYYLEGTQKKTDKDWTSAIVAFKNAGEYSDAKEQINECYYDQADELETAGNQEEAYAIFTSLGNYRDSFERANKPYYELGMSYRQDNNFGEAGKAFSHAGTYNDSDQIAKEMYYRQATNDLNEDKFADALINFRLAGDYQDSLEKAIELESKFHNLFRFYGVGYGVSVLKADGGTLTAEIPENKNGNPFSSGIVNFDKINGYAAGITENGKLELWGDLSSFAIAKTWDHIKSVVVSWKLVVALRADGTICAAADDKKLVDALGQWKNIKKIIYSSYYDTVIGVEYSGKTHVYRKNEDKSNEPSGLFDDVAIFSGIPGLPKGTPIDYEKWRTGDLKKIYAHGRDGISYVYNFDTKKWDKTEYSWYDQIVYNGNLISGKQLNTEVLAKWQDEDGNLIWELHRDGTVKSNYDDYEMQDWRLWEDQTELAKIFHWKAPEIQAKDFETTYQKAVETVTDNPQAAYDLLVSIIEYKPAREMLNSNKKLIKIRNEHFGKGVKIRMGEKNSSGLISFTVVDQNKDKILVVR